MYLLNLNDIDWPESQVDNIYNPKEPSDVCSKGRFWFLCCFSVDKNQDFYKPSPSEEPLLTSASNKQFSLYKAVFPNYESSIHCRSQNPIEITIGIGDPSSREWKQAKVI